MLFHHLYTADQSRKRDQMIIAAGTPGIVLMKRAARAALAVLLENWPDPEMITVFCGVGNNGGDGYVLAALAAEQQIPVTLYAVSAQSHLTGDAMRAAQYAVDAGVNCTVWESALNVMPTAGVVVDALLGTGIRGVPRDVFVEMIQCTNESELPVLALDVPSGLDADTGFAAGDVVYADITVTFITRKRGLYTAHAPDACGWVEYAGLQLDDALEYSSDGECVELDLDVLLEQHLPPRLRTAHKGLFGHVMIVGGDYGMGDAVSLAAEAAARVGSGLTSAATRPEHIGALLARRPEIMVSGVTSGQALEPLLEKPSVLVVGPGMGKSAWSEQMLQQATLRGLPLVVDADALNLLADGRVVREKYRENWVLTPHPAEAARLLGVTTETIQQDRFSAVQAIQTRYGGVVVLKGAGTLVCGQDGCIAVCTGGNPGMASGGMGDVLSGIIGGLMAQGLTGLEAAQLAVCLHAEAADIAASLQGERGLLASDLMVHLQALVNSHEELSVA